MAERFSSNMKQQNACWLHLITATIFHLIVTPLLLDLTGFNNGF